MSFTFTYFISHGLNLGACGPTDQVYIGNGGIDYGRFDEPDIIYADKMLSRVASYGGDRTTDHTPKAFITKDNDLYVWGYNAKGELGLGDTSPRTSPISVTSMVGIADKVYVTNENIYVITTAGKLYGAGNGLYLGQGVGNSSDQSSFVQIGTNTDWSFMKTGGGTKNIVVNTTGYAYTFDEDYMSLVPDLTTVISAATCGGEGYHSVWIMVTDDGKLWGYTKDEDSYNGIIPGQDGNTISNPIQIGASTDWASVHGTPGSSGVFALNSSGQVYYWGEPSSSCYWGTSVGHSTDIVTTPTLNTACGVFKDLFVAAEFVIGYRDYNDILGWGINKEGALGIGDVSINANVYAATGVSTVSGPYYAIPNMAKSVTETTTTINIDETNINIPNLELTSTTDVLLNSASVTLKRLRASGEILTNSGIEVALPSLSVNGNIIAGRILYDSSNMKLSLNIDATAINGISSSSAVTFPKLGINATGHLGVSANGSLSLPSLTISATLSERCIGNASLTIAALAAYGVIIGDELSSYDVLAMNKRFGSFSTHIGDGFVDSCAIGDKTLLARSDGLFEVGGKTDNGEKIASNITLPMSSIGDASLKHIRTLYVDIETNDQIKVTVTFDSGDSFTRTLGERSSSTILQTVKVIGERNIRGRAFSVEIQNQNGGELLLNNILAYIISGNRHG